MARLKQSLRRLLESLLEASVGLALDKVEQLAQSLDEMAARGGITLGAALGGARAALSGRNPVWGAITGALSSMSPAMKVALLVALVLALLLLPVLVVLVLLALIVLAIVAAARSSSAAH